MAYYDGHSMFWMILTHGFYLYINVGQIFFYMLLQDLHKPPSAASEPSRYQGLVSDKCLSFKIMTQEKLTEQKFQNIR